MELTLRNNCRVLFCFNVKHIYIFLRIILAGKFDVGWVEFDMVGGHQNGIAVATPPLKVEAKLPTEMDLNHHTAVGEFVFVIKSEIFMAGKLSLLVHVIFVRWLPSNG